ncbi:MAG: DUF669 domain-containing protein [Paludibacteraceae bacterium]|nr:DUF669 domain-containing protein [Paludibacteraceae bacterium]
MDNEDLRELNAIFKEMGGVDKVEELANSFENLPDGEYIGEIEKFETKNSKTSGKPMAVITIAVEDGKKEFKYLMLAGNDLKSTQTAVARAVSQLKKLGVDGVELGDFLTNAEKLVGTRVKMTIKTTVAKASGKEFRNTDLELA